MLDFVLNFLADFEKMNLIEFIFPPACGVCGNINSNWLCSKCEKRVQRYKKNQLFKSKEEIAQILNLNTYFYNKILTNKFDLKIEGNVLLSDEKSKKEVLDNIYFDELFYCFEYKKLIRELLLKYKFSDCAYLCNFFVNIMLKDKKINEIFKKYDIIIPVPMDKIKKSKRGYNQTELITKILSKNNIICENADCLMKVKQNQTQSTLKAEERIKNVKNVFQINDVCCVKNKKIILFDDICTTGSTVNEISRVLKEAGAKKILVLVIAKD